eukprot:2299845-Rhodomonas_salina.1
MESQRCHLWENRCHLLANRCHLWENRCHLWRRNSAICGGPTLPFMGAALTRGRGGAEASRHCYGRMCTKFLALEGRFPGQFKPPPRRYRRKGL